MKRNEMIENDYSTERFELSKTLDTRLAKINLSEEELSEITRNQTMKAIKEKGLPLLGPLGELASALIGWSDEKSEEIERWKEKKLLLQYFEKTDEQLGTVDKLKDFITDPFGFTLFNTIRSILSNTPPDSEMIDHLSTVLKNMVNEKNIELLFEQQKYVLTQIEKMTPQMLSILSDVEHWPSFTLKASTYFGGKVSSEFHNEFANAYAESKNVEDEYIIRRIVHSVRELQYSNLLEACVVNQTLDQCQCRLTAIGEEIAKYLK